MREYCYEVNKTWKSEFLYDRSFGKFIGNRLFSDCLRNRYWAYGQAEIDGITVKKAYNAVWVFAKSKLKVLSNIVLLFEQPQQVKMSVIITVKTNICVNLFINGSPQ